MIHPFDALKQQTQSPNKEDSNRDSWVGYSFIAAALWAVLRGSTTKAANPVTPLDESKADSKELSKGSVVELEHTDDKNEAKRIALQHLAEDPHYYSKLETVFPEHKVELKRKNPEDSYYLFCYGSNNPAQLKDRLERTKTPKSIGAYAEDTARIFVGHSEKWGGAVASLEKQRGKTVYGLVVQVGRRDLLQLDKFEGVNSGKYKRIELRVITQDGHELDAIAYVATTTKRGIPSQKYLKAVAKTISTHWKDSDGSDVEPSDIKINNPIPPAAVAQEAREGLELRSSVAPSRRGGTSVGIARAKQLSSRQNVSEKTMKRMKSFFARHEVDKQAKGFRKGEVGYPSKGLQAWKLWGGDSGKKWVKKV